MIASPFFEVVGATMSIVSEIDVCHDMFNGYSEILIEVKHLQKSIAQLMPKMARNSISVLRSRKLHMKYV